VYVVMVTNYDRHRFNTDGTNQSCSKLGGVFLERRLAEAWMIQNCGPQNPWLETNIDEIEVIGA
jgi:hypothetical protein